MRYRAIWLVCSLLLVAGAVRVRADEWNKKTIVTLNAPMEIPGRVLQPGSYVLKLADSQSNRNIVEIYNKDRTHLLATILAIPDYRLQPTGKTVMTFEERAAHSPQALKAWFYPGDLYGQQFVYPRNRAIQLARAHHQNVPSMPENTRLRSNALKQAPVKVATPQGTTVELAKAMPPKPPAQPKANRLALAAASPANVQTAHVRQHSMPTTASDEPILLVAGLLSFGVAAAFRTLKVRRAS